LYGRVDAVTETLDEIAAAVGEGPVLTGTAPDQAGTDPLACYAAAVALGSWWKSIGVEPDLYAGRGVGAFAAAALAGVFTVAEGASLVAAGNDQEQLSKLLSDLELRPPAADFVTDTDPAGTGAVGTTGYWMRHVADTVATSSLSAALADRDGVLIELGPAGEGASGKPVRVGSVTPSGAGAHRCLLRSAGRVWIAGVRIDWSRVNGPRPAVVPGLPTYPFQRREYWAPASTPMAADGLGVALRPRIVQTATGDTIGETTLSLPVLPFLAEHRVHGRLVVPGVVFAELVLICAEATAGGDVRVENLSLTRPLVLGDTETATVQVIISQGSRARVFSADARGGWTPHASADIVADTGIPGPETVNLAQLRDRCRERLDGAHFYTTAWHPDFRLGPSFRLVRSAMRGAGVAVATLAAPDPDAAWATSGVRPDLLMLDACAQLVAAASGEPGEPTDRPVRLGTGYRSVAVYQPLTSGEVECAAVLRDTSDGSVIGDLALANPDGAVIARLTGVTFRPVTATMLARLVADPGTGPALTVPDAATLEAADEQARTALVLEYLTNLLARVLHGTSDEVHPDEPIVDLVDSLMTAEFTGEVKQDINVDVPLEKIFDGIATGELARWIARELAPPEPEEPRRKVVTPGRRVRFMSVAEMTGRAELDPEITVAIPPSPAPPAATLLTGATGYVGAFLLAELLARRAGEVYCLVRADDEAHARRRVLANLETYGIDLSAHLDRIVPVVGDLAKPLLGLGAEAFTELHDKVGSILHCGGMVKWTYPYEGLAPANVDGTRDVLRLAVAGAARPVHFISTVGVFSSAGYPADIVAEQADLVTSGPLAVGYAQTKWVAERMVRTACERGLPTTIHRINTGGHSVTGAFNRLDHLTMVLKGCIEAGIAPTDGPMPVQPAAVDYVAAAVVELAGRSGSGGGTFHLVNDRPLTWTELFDHVEEFGYPLRRLPFEQWRHRVTNRKAGTIALLGLAPFLTDTVEHVRLPVSDSAATRAALTGSGLHCPPLDAALIATYLRGFISSGFIDAPATSRGVQR
jgi:thioester reductase-like protein